MASELLRLVGERIRTIRKEIGYTQEYLAEKAGIHYTYISDIERAERNISIDTLGKIIGALEVEPIEIFQFHNIESPVKTTNKKEVLLSLNSMLIDRKAEEIELIMKIAKEIIGTFDKNKN